jgi:hypothetical protein
MRKITRKMKTGIAALALICGVTAQAQSTFTQITPYDTLTNTPDTLKWAIIAPDSFAFGSASLTVYYEGDFGYNQEYISIYGESGYFIGQTQPYFDGSDCMADSVTLTFPASMIDTWAADDTIWITGISTFNVDLFCTSNHARVKLNYNFCPQGPVAQISGPTSPLCEINGAVSITTAPAGGTLTGTGVSGSTFDPTGLLPGDYVLTYSFTNGAACTSTSSITVSINDYPAVTIAEDTLCPFNTTTLTADGNGHIIWYSDLALTTALDTGNVFTTPTLFSTANYYAATTIIDKYFVMDSFSDADSLVIDHDAVSGDDRGGIAVTQNYVYVVGDDSTARYDLNLQNGVGFPVMDGLVSDLGTGTLYTLYNPLTGAPAYLDSMYVTELRELNADLTLGTGTIVLSDSIAFGWESTFTYHSGIYAGNGFVILYSAPKNTWYSIDLEDGVVTNLGMLSGQGAYYSENWSVWGVAEFDGNNYSVLYRDENSENIMRRGLPAQAPTVAYAFNDISDMASFTYAPWNNRWYMHFEGGSQFNGSAETLVYATAGDSTGNVESVVINCPAEVTVFVDACTGVKENGAAAVSVYPNPNNGHFAVALSDLKDAKIEIYSMEGRLVYSERINGATNIQEMDLTGLANGVYQIRVSDATSVVTAKLIKQ